MVQGPGRHTLRDIGLTGTLLLGAGALATARGASVRREQTTWRLLGVGLLLLAVSELSAARGATGPAEPGIISPADPFALAFYLCTYVAIALMVRGHLREVPRFAWLDGVVATVAAAAVLTTALAGPLSIALGSPRTALVLAYPLADAILLGLLVLGLVLVGEGGRPILWFFTAALSVLACADLVYWDRLVRATYVTGTWLDALWPAAAIGLAIAAWRPEPEVARRRTRQEVLLVAPVLSMIAATGVLVTATTRPVPQTAVMLATLTLCGVVVRLATTVAETSRLADARRLAATDELTGLPNRLGFGVSAADTLARAHHAPHRALLVIDLDGFKEVNDSLGHDAGDRLLSAVARRLEEAVRTPRDVLGRLNGDEFALLLPETDEAGAHLTARRIHDALRSPVLVDGVRVQVAASIGVSIAPQDGTDLSALLRRADLAMTRAKTARLGHAVYDDELDGEGEHRIQRIGELRIAIDSGQLVLHYQPKIDLMTGAVLAVEALVRWNRPGHGLVLPDDFLPLIEEAGLMPALTAVVLEVAMTDAARWVVAGRHLPVAVNLPTSAVVDADLPIWIRAVLRRHHAPATLLQIEITEEALLHDRVRARAVLAAVRADGIRVSIDDYGSGYSSLAYLRELTVDEVKLDKAFVLPMADDSRAAAIVRSTIELAHALGLQIVAEGVEDDRAAAMLAGYGCDTAQGYFWTRPLPEAELLAWLDAAGSRSASTTEPAGT